MKNNPYIGPRPYGRGEGNFFGREREGKELAWLILAEQAVLFYAQSGAGKTSLLNARVIPILEQKGVRVLPVARVGSGLPESIAPDQVDNIFVFSALLALSADIDLPTASLLEHTLLTYLQTYAFPSTPNPQLSTTDSQSPITNPQSPNHHSPTLLILDQFEEIATTHREQWEQAESFFRQVREALDALPGLGVLFVLREDYVAELDPYTPLLPSALQARFRMTLPTRPQAMQIVMGPAVQAGVPFAEEAAQNLVANLSRIMTVTRPPSIPPDGGEAKTSPPLGGTEGGMPGQYVEPVQLQVVCQQLWESLPESVADDGVITWDEIEHYNVDHALTTFYETTLAKVRKPSQGFALPVTERRLRRWFSEALITPEGRRGLALQGATETAGLPNAVVIALEDNHLTRAETRGGSRWYELSHDRLVEPILVSNRAWEMEQLRQRPPEILTFELDRVAIMEGQEIKLSWQVEGADEVLIEPIGHKVKLCDSLSLSPVETTQYTLKVIKGKMPATISRPQNVIVKKVHPTFWADLVIYTEQNRATPIISKAVNQDSLFILAGLPFSVYLTTNSHELMKNALAQAGKDPQTEICYWRDDLDRASFIYSREPDFIPTPDQPLIYHFYGVEAYPESLVLSDDDYMSFIKVQEDRDLVPIEVRRAMYRSWPLLLGYDWQSWEFRALFQGLLSRNLSRRPLGAFQTISYCKESEAVVDMEDYFAKYRFDIYWDDTPGFLQGLWQAWEGLCQAWEEK